VNSTKAETLAELRALLPANGDELTVLDHLESNGMAEYDLRDLRNAWSPPTRSTAH
jgi:hypothetical protein